MSLNTLAIESVAKQELQKLSRASLSSEGFSKNERDTIAAAIAAAIQAYDEQQKD